MNTFTLKVLNKVLILFFLVRLCYAEEVPDFTIGATLPLSGDLSYVGQEIIEGLELYFANSKQNKSRNIRLIYDDNKHQGNLAAGSAQYLLGIKKVNLVISLWDMADIVAPIAEKYRVPHIAIRAIPDVARSHSFTITFESTSDSYVEKEIEFLIATKSASVSILTEEAKGWNVINSTLMSKLKDIGIDLLNIEILNKDSLANHISILKVLKKKPDIILIHANNPLTEEIVKFLKLYAPNQRFSGYLENIPKKELVLGVPFIAFYDPASWFEELFYKAYHKPVLSRGAHAYDIANLIDTALMEIGSSYDSNNLINALTKSASGNGASGRIFSKTPRIIENEVVFRVFNAGGSRTIELPEAVKPFISRNINP
jgi:ABC-type branched-subunit amino acid transport system substrate-binding protein